MSLIWAFQIALDIAVVVILLKYFMAKRLGFLGLRENLARELIDSTKNINTPLGSATSTLSEKKVGDKSSSYSSAGALRMGLQMDTDSSLFGGSNSLKVNEAKRLINQGINRNEVAQKTGLSHAELSLLEKMMMGGVRD